MRNKASKSLRVLLLQVWYEHGSSMYPRVSQGVSVMAWVRAKRKILRYLGLRLERLHLVGVACEGLTNPKPYLEGRGT